MAERIHYDDDPADTAAGAWTRTPLGQSTIVKATTSPIAAVQRAFRTGYLRGQLQARREGAEPEGGKCEIKTICTECGAETHKASQIHCHVCGCNVWVTVPAEQKGGE